MILIQVIPFTGLLTADPKDRLKLSDLSYSEWVQGFSVIPEPTTQLLISDSAFDQADQEGFAVEVSSVISSASFIVTCKVIL
jgi:hypothetical protein